MPTLQIRDIPLALYNKIVNSAEKSKRSLAQQAIFLLEEGIISKSKRAIKHELIKKIQVLYEKEPIFNIKIAMKRLQEDRES